MLACNWKLYSVYILICQIWFFFYQIYLIWKIFDAIQKRVGKKTKVVQILWKLKKRKFFCSLIFVTIKMVLLYASLLFYLSDSHRENVSDCSCGMWLHILEQSSSRLGLLVLVWTNHQQYHKKTYSEVLFLCSLL